MKTVAKTILVIVILVMGIMVQYSLADVTPGDVITKDNYEKILGMVPDPVLNWVKKGEMELRIGILAYNPDEYFSPEAIKSFKYNKGKYDLNKEDGIIDAKTGKLPDFIQGIPFPETNSKDPKFIQKLMYNSEYSANINGNMSYLGPIEFIGRSGHERNIITEYRRIVLDGNTAAQKLPNPKNAEFYEIVLVKEPYDMAGIATMTHRFRDPSKLDLVYNYIPDIRRARRASPVNRSENFASTDFAIDDVGGFGGKIPNFEWKFMYEKEALVPFLTEKPGMVKKKENGDWETTGKFGYIVPGYQEEGWKGAPWAMTNVIWVKQKVYVAELKSKNPAYNYGVQYSWIDAGTFLPTYKIIYNRNDKHWKTGVNVLVGLDSPTGEKKLVWFAGFLMVDEHSDHACFIESASEKNTFVWPARLNMNDFSLGGFAKFCK
jgi:hypothetical protein